MKNSLIPILKSDIRRVIRYIILANCFLSLSLPMAAEKGWHVQNPLPTETHLFTLEYVTNNLIFAGGMGGTLVKTSDGGRSWEVQKFKDLVDIRSMWFRDSLNGWLVDNSHVMKTVDGGSQWTSIPVQADLTTYFFDKILGFNDTIYLFLKPRTAILSELITADSRILKSIDGGRSWTLLPEKLPGKMLSVSFLNERIGYVYTEVNVSISEGYTALYKTTDGGMTWTGTKFPGVNWSLSLVFLNQKVGFIGRYKTVDGGATWDDVLSPLIGPTGTVNAMSFQDSLHGCAVSDGLFIETADGGDTWSIRPEIATQVLRDVSRAADGSGWAVGMAGNIFRKENPTSNWVSMSRGVKQNLNDIFFIDELEGWAVGTGGAILHTTDGGEHWEEQISNVGNVFFAVKFLDRNEGWIVGQYIVMHTTDGGRTWMAVENMREWYVDIDFFDQNNGILICHDGKVFTTSDKGREWQPIPGNSLNTELKEIAIVNDHEAWIGGLEGLGHTVNKAGTVQWHSLPMFRLVLDIQFVDAQYGFLLSEYGTLFMTQDGGWNWKEMERNVNLATGPIQAFSMLNRSSGLIYSADHGGYLKNIRIDGSMITETGDDRFGVASINDILYLNSKHGWAIGPGGRILKYVGTDTLISQLWTKNVRNFPNPFDANGTSIVFSLARSQHGNISIYNILGEKVQTVVDAILPEGDNTILWSPDNCAQGIYFIVVKCDDFSEIKKVIYVQH